MKILAIKHINTKATEGKPSRSLVLVSTAGRDHFITPGQWKSAGASASLDNYVGGDIDARYFEEGEELFDGTVCTASDKILDQFSVSQNPEVLARIGAIEAADAMQGALDKSALFKRQREAAKAKLAAKADTVLSK